MSTRDIASSEIKRAERESASRDYSAPAVTVDDLGPGAGRGDSDQHNYITAVASEEIVNRDDRPHVDTSSLYGPFGRRRPAITPSSYTEKVARAMVDAMDAHQGITAYLDEQRGKRR